MEYSLLFSLSMVWILGASTSQQFYNPLGNSTTNVMTTDPPPNHDKKLPPHVSTSAQDSATTTSTSDALESVSSDSMRALLDVPASPSGNFDSMTYQEYYDSLPYYDIVDYYYIEEDGNANTSAANKASSSRTNANNSLSTNQPLKDSSQTRAQTNYDAMSFLTTRSKSETEATPCDVMTHFGCDVSRFERCDSVTQSCRCIGGFLKAVSRSNSPDACTAAKFLHGNVHIPMANSKVNTLSSQAVRIVRNALWDYIKYSMKKHKTDDILLALDMRTSGVRSSKNPSMLQLTYEVALHRDASSIVSGQLRNVLQKELRKATNGRGPPEEFTKIIGQMSSQNSTFYKTDIFSPLIEIRPCSSPEHTYCARDAQCRVENGSLTCECLPGFQDVSPDLGRFPGEVCEEQCHCENQGTCVPDPDDYTVKECSCVNWFFGSRCHVNGKELLITCISCVAGIAIIVTIICCCCHARVRHRNRHTESSLFRFTPDTSILKLPRVWMEAHYPDSDTMDKDISPQSIRRMSIATECNPYFDGYILEDVAASCLHSDRSTDTHTPHHEATLGTIGGAATISSHSIFRHY